MQRRILSIFAALAMLSALGACSDSVNTKVSDSDNVSTAVSNTSNTVSSSDAEWNPTVMQRQILLDEGAMCGVVYLGYGSLSVYDHNFTDDRQYFIDLINESGYADSFEFLLSMPDDYWVETPGGQDLYLIIPYDEQAHVEVNCLVMNEDNNFEGESGENLYTKDSGAPFLLKCNYSDILPECEVLITDSNGEVLNWRPFTSLRDGTVSTDTQNGTSIYDFTVYPEGVKEDILFE